MALPLVKSEKLSAPPDPNCPPAYKKLYPSLQAPNAISTQDDSEDLLDSWVPRTTPQPPVLPAHAQNVNQPVGAVNHLTTNLSENLPSSTTLDSDEEDDLPTLRKVRKRLKPEIKHLFGVQDVKEVRMAKL